MVMKIKEKKIMVCRRCGKEIEPSDRFCRSCGTPVRTPENSSGEKQEGYKDDIESTMGRFDGKYMAIAGVILAVLIIVGAVRKMTYTPQANSETAVEMSTEESREE
jgi:uncharacterized membrane protein YvbJ